MNILLVIPCHVSDAAKAERLMDWIFELSDRNPGGHCLVVCAADVPPEIRIKLNTAAGLTFDSHELIIAPPSQVASVNRKTNELFAFTALHILRHNRLPWLWCEPDCVFLTRSWSQQFSQAYENQPKRYLGNHLRLGMRLALGKISIYPPDAAEDVSSFVDLEEPFWLAAGSVIVPRSTKSKLVQYGTFDPAKGMEQIRPDAVLFHSDKTGALMEMIRAGLKPTAGEQVAQLPPEVAADILASIPKRRGRPPKVKVDA